jgi:hypothetical protein
LGQKENIEKEALKFSVDAGIINRLGIELVGRSETAVSELIKNSYDADSTRVDVMFKYSNEVGGSLIIDDDGEGMTFHNLENGFMRLSSTDKVHNPISEKYRRKKAGKKGIGRFATQRLGTKLIIVTKTIGMTQAIKLVINWDDYQIDTDLSKIENKASFVDPIKNHGTKLTIEGLRDIWTNVEIRRVYRYISNLLQPDFLSERVNELNLAKDDNIDNSFAVYCNRINTNENQPIEVSAPQKMIFNKSIATIEGVVDEHHYGFCDLKSSKFDLYDVQVPVSSSKEKEGITKFNSLKNIRFKAYYFIYNRPEYYDFDNNFTQLELNSIQKTADESSGIKLYRNGFRVYPYGEKGNDWLNIDRKLAKLRSDTGVNIPFGNQNLFGFIEIIESDTEEKSLFEETASREGLIEDKTFNELQDFIYKTLHIAMLRIASADKFLEAKKKREKNFKRESGIKEGDGFDVLKKSIEELKIKINQDDPDKNDYLDSFLKNLPEQIHATELDLQEKIKENGMLRVLAGIGLVIGEFVHEIEQFDTIFKSRIKFLKKKIDDEFILSKVNDLEIAFSSYQSYTAYFRGSVSQNVYRNIEPINLKMTVNSFIRQIGSNLKKANIDIDIKFLDQYLFTCPMHPSEWLSILFNLYTNSKKAIKRSTNNRGLILIKISNVKGLIHLEFLDNGDGISTEIEERIFTPFYTTSNPVNPEELDVKDNSGTGLGLYIIKKIINSYNGTISLSTPSEEGYNTNFKITLPASNE